MRFIVTTIFHIKSEILCQSGHLEEFEEAQEKQREIYYSKMKSYMQPFKFLLRRKELTEGLPTINIFIYNLTNISSNFIFQFELI